MKFIELFAGIGGFRYGLEHIDVSQKRGRQETSQEEHEKGEGLHSVPSKGSIHQDRWDNELRDGGVDERQFTCVYANEFNKYATQIYEKNYEKPDTRDIREVKETEIPKHDLLTAGFPCQSFSVAGKRGGFRDTGGTLFFQIARIAKQKQPRLLLLENVKGLLSHDKGKTFGTILNTLDELGYDCQWQVLNSKDFGVPQNRERVFIIGHLRGTSRPEVFPIGGQSKNTLKELTTGQSQGMRAYSTKGTSTTIAGLAGGWGAKTGLYATPKIRRLTPTECERLQGFPDGWTKEGLSSIMEICVNISPAIEKQLPKLDTASSITKDGNVMELQSYPNGLRSDVSIVVEKLLPVNSVIDIISRGNAMVMLYSQNETLSKDELTKLNHILEKTEEKSTKTLLKICLEGNWNEEKLSTILTLIKETIASPTSTFAKIDENIIGVIIVLNKLEQNYSSEALLGLKMVSIVSISDTQRYKCLGNAVTTNVITAIGKRLLSFS